MSKPQMTAKEAVRDSLAKGPGTPGISGETAQEKSKFSAEDKELFKKLLVKELLHAMGNPPFHSSLARDIMSGIDPTPEQVTHFLDEAGKFQDKLTKAEIDLLNRLA